MRCVLRKIICFLTNQKERGSILLVMEKLSFIEGMKDDKMGPFAYNELSQEPYF